MKFKGEKVEQIDPKDILYDNKLKQFCTYPEGSDPAQFDKEYILENCVKVVVEPEDQENINYMKDHKQLYICSCNSTEHQMIFFPSPDKEEKIIFVHIHLNKKPFWKRVTYAFKYIFGYKCRYGAFDEILLDESHSKQLSKAAKYLNSKL